MSLALHASAGSCSLAPHIVLHEIGKPLSLAMISTDRGDARTDAFKAINPKGRVPVLVDGEFSLTEAPAILFYLAQSSPQSNLMPTGQDGLVRALEWFNWLSGTVHAVAVRMIWRADYFSIDPNGTDHSVVDPYLLVFYRWGNRMKINMKDRYPVWTEHTLRLIERTAVQRALATEKISIWQ